MNQNDKNKLEKFGMTHNQIRELKSFLVERYVDNMSTKDLVAYVMDDLDRYYEKMSDVEFIDEAQNYWEDHFDEVVEEVEEYAEAARAGDLVEVLDALADIGYILAGTIINHGMQHIYDDAFDEVHRSNMAKLVDGKVLRREDGKVMKPEGWQPPNLAQFLE